MTYAHLERCAQRGRSGPDVSFVDPTVDLSMRVTISNEIENTRFISGRWISAMELQLPEL